MVARRQMVVPMNMGRAASVPVDVGVVGYERALAPQRGVKRIVRRPRERRPRKRGCLRMRVPMIELLPIDRIIAVPGRMVMVVAVTVVVAMTVTVLMAIPRLQLAPGGNCDPAAKTDQGDTGERIDEMAEAVGESDPGQPHGRRDQQGRDDMAGPGLQRRPRGFCLRPARCRPISAIGTQWSGTIVCRTPTAATAPTSSSSGPWITARPHGRPYPRPDADAGDRDRDGCAGAHGGCRRRGCADAREKRFRAAGRRRRRSGTGS